MDSRLTDNMHSIAPEGNGQSAPYTAPVSHFGTYVQI